MNNFLELRKQIIRKTFLRMNNMQFEAVVRAKGPLLILAGAGSGKTTVIVNRIANLIRYGDAYNSEHAYRPVTQQDISLMNDYLNSQSDNLAGLEGLLEYDTVKPWEILAITFTNKAAGELKNRLGSMLGEAGSGVWASTFHSCCTRILRRDGAVLGFSSHFTIYDTDDSRRTMKEVQRALEIDDKRLSHKAILTEISHAKDSLISPEEFLKSAQGDERTMLIGRAYAKYQERLKTADAMDFDDIIVNTVRLFMDYPDILSHYQNRFKYIMVDEYQDTNHAQYMLTKLLADAHKNICVVGDDDQSIYRFRGATIRNILDFEKNYPDTKIIRLEQNYRSTQTILDAANSVIANNTERKGKELWTKNPKGDKIMHKITFDEQSEARYIADEITDSSASGKSWNDHAVLYRMNAQSNNIERALVRAGIPYRIIGGHRFYDRKEIKDALAYLSVIVNPADDIRLMRIINEPKRGIGNSTLAHIARIAAGLGTSMFEVIKTADEYEALSRPALKLRSFASMINRFISLSGTLPPHELLKTVLNESSYMEYLAEDPATYDDRTQNLDELVSNILRFTQENPDGGLQDFLEDVALMSDIDNYNADSDTVILMTLHSAKGLEFPVCFIAGIEEGVFPSSQSMYNQGELEEERRLAYVGITRTRQKLYLISAGSRMLYGSTSHNRPSRFVNEIPEELKDVRNDMTYGIGAYTAPYTADYSRKDLPSGPQPFKKQYSGSGGFGRQGFAPSPAAKEKEPLGSYKPGDTVIHKKFGTGVIIKCEAMGNDMLLEVAFQDYGTKKLMARAARLEKM